MNSIVKASPSDFKLLSDIGKKTFLESHGKSAPKAEIDFYVDEKYSYTTFQEELSNANNIYHIVYYKSQPIGYSKIVYNNSTSNIQMDNVTKLERLYLLKEFHELKMGLELFKFNVQLSKNNNQVGIWLFVWKENEKAVNFYLRNGFQIIGDHNFKISETHSNPNYQMLLQY